MRWSCPVCRLVLDRVARTWCCANGHSFDIAKQGYCNLLLAHHKRSKAPGDSKEMLLGRRAFLDAGHYEPLANAIATALAPHLPPNATLLDCGCGEGYYAQRLRDALPIEVFGIDIARDGVRMAAARCKDNQGMEFAVASARDVPLSDGSVDAVVQVFAPSSDQQVRRLLKADGVYCAVFPGPKHLWAFKERLYDQAREHGDPVETEGHVTLSQTRLRFELNLRCNADIRHLLAMTPLNWKGSREAKAALQAADAIDVEADFLIRVSRPLHP